MEKYQAKICLLADSHSLYDDRIYWKEACSLKKAGNEVHIILAGDQDRSGKTKEDIHYELIRRDQSSNRYLNYFFKHVSPKGLYHRMLKQAEATKADVFHIHDLKLLRLVSSLKNLPNKPKVIYDVHEPYPENILDYDHKPVAIKLLGKKYAQYIRKWERRNADQCDLIITTEENLEKRFKQYYPDKPVEIIYNYTNLQSIAHQGEEESKVYDAIYTGGITRLRGAWNILEAVSLVREKLPKFKVLFVGSWFPAELKEEMIQYINQHELAENIILKDSVPYSEIGEYYKKSRIGLGIFLPIQTHRIILQIKIFEYMNFGLPIVGSNFGHIYNIIQKHECGIAVDPEKPEKIAGALIELSTNPDLLNKLSINGRTAADQNYRWDQMEEKLIHIYKQILS